MSLKFSSPSKSQGTERGGSHYTKTDWAIITPAQLQMVGPSGCGKSERILQLVEHDGEIFDRAFGTVIYAAPEAHDRHEYLARLAAVCLKKKKALVTAESVPSVREITGMTGGDHVLLILDDVASFANVKGLSNLATTHSHHANITMVTVLQNPYSNKDGLKVTDLNRNVTGRFIFYSLNDWRLLSTMSRSVFPERPDFLTSCICDAKSQGANYVFLNLACFSKLNRRHIVYTNLFPTDRGKQESPLFFDLQAPK